jgi:hypothetical protein
MLRDEEVQEERKQMSCVNTHKKEVFLTTIVLTSLTGHIIIAGIYNLFPLPVLNSLCP